MVPTAPTTGWLESLGAVLSSPFEGEWKKTRAAGSYLASPFQGEWTKTKAAAQFGWTAITSTGSFLASHWKPIVATGILAGSFAYAGPIVGTAYDGLPITILTFALLNSF